MSARDGFVLLPVPEDDYDAVITLLAQRRAGKHAPVDTAPSAATDGRWPHRQWTAADIAQLKQATTNAFLVTTMDMLCERGARAVVSFAEVVGRSGLTHNQIRASASGLTKTIHHRFDRDNWPFRVDWTIDSTAHYVCDDQHILDWWNDA